MSDKKDKLRVVMCTDPMASCVHDNDQGAEYDAIEKELQDVLVEFDLSFERNIFPYQLKNKPFDIYLFDFGGMTYGCEDTVASHFAELARQAEDHPSAVFIIYSTFSVRIYKECLENELGGEITEQPNVVLYDCDDKWHVELRERLGLGKKEEA